MTHLIGTARVTRILRRAGTTRVARLLQTTWSKIDPRPAEEAREPQEQGITTAEYAVGTAAGAGLAGVLYAMVIGGFGDRMLTTLFDHVLSLLGVG